jgi:hypothetical protein
MPPQLPIAGAGAAAAEAGASVTSAAKNSISDLGVKAAGLQSLQEAASILTGLKNLLYDIARNPLLAPMVGMRIETQILNLVNGLKKLRTEASETNKTWGMLKGTLGDNNTMVRAGAGIFSLGLKMKSFRDEVQKTQLELYKVRGGGAVGGGGYDNAMGFTRQVTSMQAQYGPEFSRNYKRVVIELQQRMTREGTGATQQGKMFELITGLSTATGTDYSRAITTLQDSFAQYGMTVPKAVASTDMIRDAWLKGETAIGNLNENIEAGVQLMKEFGDAGSGPDKAREAMLGAMKTAQELGLTVSAMMNLQGGGRGMSQLGMGGVQAQLEFKTASSLTGLSKRQKEIVSKPMYHGRSIEEIMGFAQSRGKEGQTDYSILMQEQARLALPKQNGVYDPNLVESMRDRILTGTKLGGQNTAMMTGLANAKDIANYVPGGNASEAYNAKVASVTDKSFAEVDKGAQTLVESAITWSEKLDGEIKRLGIELGAVSDAVSTLTMVIGGSMFLKGTVGNLGGGKGGIPIPGGGGGGGGIILDQFGNKIPGTGGGGGVGGFGGVGSSGTGKSGAIGLGTIAVGIGANMVAQQIMGAPVNAIQAKSEEMAKNVPGGSVAALAGRSLGGYVAGMFGHLLGHTATGAYEEDVYNQMVIDEKKGYKMKESSANYKTRTQKRDEEMEFKYSASGTAERAVSGDTISGNMPAIQNTINVYVDSQLVAAHVEQQAAQTAKSKAADMG